MSNNVPAKYCDRINPNIYENLNIIFTDLFTNLLTYNQDADNFLTLISQQGDDLSEVVIFTNEANYYNWIDKWNDVRVELITNFSNDHTVGRLVFFNCWPKVDYTPKINDLLFINDLIVTNKQQISTIMNSNICFEFFNTTSNSNKENLFCKNFLEKQTRYYIFSKDLHATMLPSNTMESVILPPLLQRLENAYNADHAVENTVFVFKPSDSKQKKDMNALFNDFRLFYTTMTHLNIFQWSIDCDPLILVQLNILFNIEYNNIEWLVILNKFLPFELDIYLKLWFDSNIFSIAGAFIPLHELEYFNSKKCFQTNFAPIVGQDNIKQPFGPLNILGGFPWNNLSMASLTVDNISYGPWIFQNKFNLIPQAI